VTLKAAKFLAAAAVVALLLGTGCHHKRPKSEAGPTEVVPVATLYAKGQEAMRKKRYATARRYFDQIYKEHTIEGYAEAISRYQSFLSFHPTHPEAAYCQYQIGDCWYNEIDTPDRDLSPALHARQAFSAVLENYPTSQYAADSTKKLSAINDLLCAHEIKVGDWYLKDGHPKGAIGRYRYAIEKYPKYWNMPLLYSRLGEALYRDGQDKEALLYFTRITQEVPGTVLAKSADKSIRQIQKREKASLKKDKAVFKEPLVPEKKAKHWWEFWK
jgi:outer membrane protein assembly factor BamD (BamD/ComL family)